MIICDLNGDVVTHIFYGKKIGNNSLQQPKRFKSQKFRQYHSTSKTNYKTQRESYFGVRILEKYEVLRIWLEFN